MSLTISQSQESNLLPGITLLSIQRKDFCLDFFFFFLTLLHLQLTQLSKLSIAHLRNKEERGFMKEIRGEEPNHNSGKGASRQQAM